MQLSLLTAVYSHHCPETPIAGGSGAVTVVDSTGKLVQVSQSTAAQAQMGLVQPGPDGTVAVQGSDGKPVKISQAALAPTQTGGKKAHVTKIKVCMAFYLECNEQLRISDNAS